MLWPHIPDWFEFVIGCLAVFRLTSILHHERIAYPIRKRFGILEGEDVDLPLGDVRLYPDNFWGNLFECFWCLSVWVSFPVGLYICLLAPYPALFLLVPFALSAGAIIIEERM